MSSFFRLAVSGFCCLAMMFSVAIATAQQPPGGPPSEEGGGPPPGVTDAGDEVRGNRRKPRKRGASKFANGGGQVDFANRNDTKKKKKASAYEDLLANKDLSKFRGYKQETIGKGWSIDGKYLHFDGTKSGDLVTKDSYESFDLQFEWKVTEGANSGVMYRVSLGDNAPYFSGPEYQILDDDIHQDGKKEITSAGSLYALYPPAKKRLKPVGTWNKSRIVVKGSKVTHYLNNYKVVQADMSSDDWKKKVKGSKFASWNKFGKNAAGHIVFQDHGDEVWYRKIKIKEVDPNASADSKTAAKAKAKAPRRGASKFANGAGQMDFGGKNNAPSEKAPKKNQNRNRRQPTGPGGG